MSAFETHEKHAPLVVGRAESVHVFGEDRDRGPRFHVRIVDVSQEATCSCFIVPQGREHEYVFGSDDGLAQVAASAKCGRLLAVSLLSRGGHAFGDLKAVQKELEGAVVDLAPPGCAGSIAFVTAGGDLGSRTVVASGPTASGDTYYVEEVDEGSARVRRLVFASNDRVVQTEVALLPPAKKKAAKGKGKKKAPKAPRDDGARRVDGDDLRSAYHAAMLAACGCAARVDDVLLVGLGGGALASALRRYRPAAAVAVRELDGAIVDVAAEWFGFRHGDRDARTTVEVGDGLDAFEGLGDGDRFDVVAVDVDAKDASLGMCCPPKAFVAVDYLEKARRHLRDGGVFVVNVVARRREDYAETCAHVKTVFGNVRVLRATPDDVNRVLVACATESDDWAARGKAALSDWLLGADRADDPHELLDLFAKLEVAGEAPPR